MPLFTTVLPHWSRALPISFVSTGLLHNKYQDELEGRLFMESGERSVDDFLLCFYFQEFQNRAALRIRSLTSGSRKSLQLEPLVGGRCANVWNGWEVASSYSGKEILIPRTLFIRERKKLVVWRIRTHADPGTVGKFSFRNVTYENVSRVYPSSHSLNACLVDFMLPSWLYQPFYCFPRPLTKLWLIRALSFFVKIFC